MIERRPHWDAELCNAVYDAALEAYKDGLNGGAYDIFPIIAAVEDWQAEKRRGEAAFSWLMARDARQVAAIQRVRELLASGTFEAIRGAQRTRVVSAYHLRKALDGGA
jgi:hypothetical protein